MSLISVPSLVCPQRAFLLDNFNAATSSDNLHVVAKLFTGSVLSSDSSEPRTGPLSPEPKVQFEVRVFPGPNRKSSSGFSKIRAEPD
jgi:hypothetical protein